MARVPSPWFWEARDAWYVTISGERHRLSLGKGSKSEATREFARLMARDGRPLPRRSNPTVAEVCDLFLGHVHASLAKGTYDQHRMKLTAFCRRFGRVKVGSLTVSGVQAWLSTLTCASMTKRGYVISIKACLNWCVSESVIGANPLVKLPRPEATRRERVLDASERVQVVESTMGLAIGPFIRGLLALGCRPHELATLTAGDVDWGAGTARVIGKGRPRTVYLPASILLELRSLADLNPVGPLYRNARGQPWSRNGWRCAFRRLRAKTGLEGVVAYTMRHTVATDRLADGESPALLGKLLGHKDWSMLQDVYGKVERRPDALRAASERMVASDRETGT